MVLNVHLERFEGPLALLLHLIRQEEMDIFDININQITHQYLEFIKAMKKLDLEMAGEFVAMAATLIHIKSKMLLPQYDPETGEPIQEDPRKELVQKLVEYQKFQQASKDLYQRPILGRDVFTRGYRTDIDSMEEGELILEEKPLFSMIKAYRFAMKNMKKTIHRVIGDLQSIAGRILEMKDQLIVGVRVPFTTLLQSSTHQHNQVLVTFLSLLELAKMGLVSLFQVDPTTEIHVEAKKTIDRDVISQTESYDNANAAEKADQIFAMAAGAVSLDEGKMNDSDEYDQQQELPLDPAVMVDSAHMPEMASDEEILAAERELNFIDIEEIKAEPTIEDVQVELPPPTSITEEILSDTVEANLDFEQQKISTPEAESFVGPEEVLPETAAEEDAVLSADIVEVQSEGPLLPSPEPITEQILSDVIEQNIEQKFEEQVENPIAEQSYGEEKETEV